MKETLFDKFKILHGFPRTGQVVKYVKPTRIHYFHEVIKNENQLTLGETYTTKATQLNSSSAYIWLEEFSKCGEDHSSDMFSIWAFSWDKIFPTDEELIGFRVTDLFTLERSFDGIHIDKGKFDVFKNGKLEFYPVFDKDGIIKDIKR